VDGSNEYHKKIDNKKLAMDVKIATYLEFFSTTFWFPLIIKIKKDPIKGTKMIAERIGKFI